MRAKEHRDNLHDSFEIRALRARAKAQLLLGAVDEALVDAQAALDCDELCCSAITLGLVKLMADDFFGVRCFVRTHILVDCVCIHCLRLRAALEFFILHIL